MMASNQEMADKVQAVYGQQIVAFGMGIKDPKIVGQWAKGHLTPNPGSKGQKLGALYQICKILQSRHQGEGSSNLIRAWILAPNPSLYDVSAIEQIREGNPYAAVRAALIYTS